MKADRISKANAVHQMVVELLPMAGQESEMGFWTNEEEEIICETAEEAGTLADFFDSLYGCGTVYTGQYTDGQYNGLFYISFH